MNQRRTIAYPFRFADGYMAQVVIPADLSQSECQRLAAFLETLVVPWTQPVAVQQKGEKP